mgnify:CR=1 FL=1
MKTIEQYYNWFFLSQQSANNKLADCPEKLRVSPIKKVSQYEPLNIEDKYFSFAEKNNDWKIEYFHWLKSFLQIENNGYPPTFIFDNHNQALFFRYYTTHEKKDIKLIHIDQHSDCRENNNKLNINHSESDFDTIFHFTNELCNVGNFIPPAIENHIISSQTQIRSYTSLKELKINKNENFILDLDLDFCLNWMNRDKIDENNVTLLINKFKEISPYATCITIATSPYFLNQEIAINIIEKLIK